jgi:hypothetical protein
MNLYKKFPAGSQDQFLKDFGEFPPKPLTTEASNHTFDVIYLSGFGMKYYSLSRSFRIFNSGASDIKDENLRGMYEEVQRIKHDVKASFFNVFSSFKSINLIQKIGTIFLLTLVSPFLLLIFLFLLLNAVYRMYRVPTIGTESLGFFSPAMQQKSEIVVRPKAIRKARISLDAIISHEHIHLLQHRIFLNRKSDLLGLKFKENLKGFLNESALQSEEAFYYLSLNEVEARLHEVVLSHYRAHGNLPSDYQDFLVMILSCDVLGEPVSRILSKYDVTAPEYVGREYSLREFVPAEDLAIMLGYFPDFSYAKRFVCEALSVMYGNLLILYGDSDKAFEYLKTIECSDFYTQLYGEHSIPKDRSGA